MWILKRIGNVIEGLVFIILSLCVQAFFVAFLSMAVGAGWAAVGLPESDALYWVIFGLLIVAINCLACWEYFRQGTANIGFGTASIIFMFPRALDLIWNGSERISR